ncbi:unnamed protein product [Vicia faba]|uniref:F-box domain-containing protein n=1 Tax=Vicia faba TaxID=3906 RepID=A0AAV1B7I5_VICFA|nr:unnamed protein product [Vicia faba]
MRPITRKKVRANERVNRNQGKPDLISTLPDGVLSSILSSLSIDEAVRSSILSKRWIPLWKYAPHLDFDGTRMMKSFVNATGKDAREYGKLVNSILHHHLGDLISCRFIHLPKNLIVGDVKGWIEYVMEKNKRMTHLSLECWSSICCYDIKDMKPNFRSKIFSVLCSLELTNYVLARSVLSAFESCENLKILKLKKMKMKNETINGILKKCLGLEKFSLIGSIGFDILKIKSPGLKFLELKKLRVKEIEVYAEDLQVVVIDSLVCPGKCLKIYSQNLRTFSSSYDQTTQMSLKTHEILENCSDLFESQMTNIFLFLLTLSIELNLNNLREVLPLSYILRSCIHLKTLEITIPIVEAFEDCELPYPKSIFWERQQMYNCINHKIKFVTMRGFTGKVQEVKFLKHLITRACVMEKINVICDSRFVDEANDLLSLPRASPYLSIIVKSKT